ncbi:hypothetical protein GCM10023185_02110 [Hymenobacter saemangeumensis]|uniref:Glycosyltransferase subfamily 4-like N-terminal domain-containing protein n=1 Tax=Hymenobacter saemangeumensis TaxID=1084522 RepID=A0ABP8HXZ5_9BACT
MTQPLFPLLVLAWDDDDASPCLPGEQPMPPLLPLLRALAARHPLLAVLPQLPEAVRDQARLDELAQAPQAAGAALPHPGPGPAIEAESRPESVAPAPSSDADDVAPATEPEATSLVAAGPASASVFALGVPLQAANAASPEPASISRLIGLADVGFVTSAPPLPAAPVPSAPRLRPADRPQPPRAGFTPFVWPAVPRQQPGLVPAAPYLGSSAQAGGNRPALGPPYPHVPPPPAPPRPRPESPLPAPRLVADLAFDPDPELPLRPQAVAPPFALTPAEPGPAEAAALSASADNLSLSPAEAGTALPPPAAAPAHLPSAPARASLTQGLAALRRSGEEAMPAPAPTAAAEPAPALPALSDDLHYRIIQYARFATHASSLGEEFGIIYAPSWPTWLAALEIRYRLRCPLVLHLSDLARDSAAPADRGWRLEVERYALRRAHTVLVTTDELRQRVLRHYSLHPERVQVLAATDAAGIAALLAGLSLTALPSIPPTSAS